MHRFSQSPANWIMGRFSRRAMLVGLAAAAVPALGGAVEAPVMPQAVATSDPLADTIAEYHAGMADFMAIPLEQITEENEAALVAATYGPANDRLWHDTPLPTSLRGVREASRYAVKEDGFIDRVAESVVKAALAYLDREIGS